MNQRSALHARIEDVSDNNGAIDWMKEGSSPVVAYYAKATEGATFKDPTFPQNYAGIKRIGKDRGAYCLVHPRTSTVADEVQAFVDYVRANGGFELRPMVDSETSEGLTPQQLADFYLSWESEIRIRGAVDGIILYMNLSMVEYLAPVADKLAHIPLWLADYTTGQIPDIPGWSKWTILQYTDKGTSPGISGNVDESEFDGNAQQLLAELSSNPTTQPGGGSQTVTTYGLDKAQVEDLQTKLKAVLGLGANFAIDGDYGPATTTAVKTFQFTHKLTEDGIAGPITMKTLDAAYAAKTQVSKPTPTPAPQPTNKEKAIQLIEQALTLLKQ